MQKLCKALASRSAIPLIACMALAACANAPRQSISSKILTCDYASELEVLDDLPVTDDALLLQDWAIGAIFANKRNREMRRYSADCITNILKEDE